MVKRLYLILLLLLGVVAPMSAVLTVDNTAEPISDNHAIGCKTIVNYFLKKTKESKIGFLRFYC